MTKKQKKKNSDALAEHIAGNIANPARKPSDNELCIMRFVYYMRDLYEKGITYLEQSKNDGCRPGYKIEIKKNKAGKIIVKLTINSVPRYY